MATRKAERKDEITAVREDALEGTYSTSTTSPQTTDINTTSQNKQSTLPEEQQQYVVNRVLNETKDNIRKATDELFNLSL